MVIIIKLLLCVMNHQSSELENYLFKAGGRY